MGSALKGTWHEERTWFTVTNYFELLDTAVQSVILNRKSGMPEEVIESQLRKWGEAIVDQSLGEQADINEILIGLKTIGMIGR